MKPKHTNSTLSIQQEDYSLLTDLYQLTMSACYQQEGIEDNWASFELFVRRLPEGFGYLISMGLEQVLEYLQNLHFAPAHIAELKKTGIFHHVPPEFWSMLSKLKFKGDLWAVPEGTPIFANEPILRIEAPLWQAQLVETYLLNNINYQTLIATRAGRLRDVIGETAQLMEFGTRRAFGPQASLYAARAGLAAGFDSTSNVLAAAKLNCRPSGTMAHALVMALSATQGTEMQAFTAFHKCFPHSSLLIDTYDTVKAAEMLAEKVNKGEMELTGIRLDSGDLITLSQKVRSLLPNVKIFASNDLDEREIVKLQKGGSCIDGYGIGTKLVTGTPVNGVYKLVEIEGIPVMKQSTGKPSYPCKKQIFRKFEEGKIIGDRLGLMSEEAQENEQPLLKLIMREGQRLQKPETLAEIAQRTRENIKKLPLETREIDQPKSIAVEISSPLLKLTEKTKERYSNQ
jgi:nicotinate phosphoribosyltransferase